MTRIGDKKESHGGLASSTPLARLAFAALRYRKSVTLCILIGTAFGFAYGMVQPNAYESVGKLLVRPGFLESASPEAALIGSGSNQPYLRMALESEMHVITDPTVYEETARAIPADLLAKPYDPVAIAGPDTPWPTRILHRAQRWWFRLNSESGPANIGATARALQRGLTIQSNADSGIVTVRYVSHAPAAAREVVAAYLEACLQHHRRVFAPDPSLKVLETAHATADEAANASARKLAEYRRDTGIFDVEIERARLVEYYLGIQKTIDEDEAELNGQRAQRELLLQTIEKVPPTRPQTTSAAPILNPRVAAQSSLLQSLQLQRINLLAQQRTIEPELFKQQLDELDRLIRATDEDLLQAHLFVDPPRPDGAEENPRFARLQEELDATGRRMASLEVRRTEWRERLQATRERLVELERKGNELAELDRAAQRERSSADALWEQRLSLLRLKQLDDVKIGSLRVLQHATMPNTKVGPARLRALVIGMFLGLVSGMALALARQLADPRLRRVEDAEHALATPCLGVVEQRSRRTTRDSVNRLARFQPEIESLWSRLLPDGPPETRLNIGFAAPRRGGGSSTMAECAAVGLARHAHAAVTLIECDASHPTLAETHGIDGDRGWTGVVSGRLAPADAIRPTADQANLSLVPAGNASLPTGGHYASPGFRQLLAHVQDGRDFVIYDLPPLLEHADAKALLWHLDAVVLVLRSGGTTAADAREAAEIVRRSGTDLFGFVLNLHQRVWPFWLPGRQRVRW